MRQVHRGRTIKASGKWQDLKGKGRVEVSRG